MADLGIALSLGVLDPMDRLAQPWNDLPRVTSEEQLEALYGAPGAPALIKEIDYISDHYRAFIEASPFVILASSGPEGLDCSPRGDPPGFVRVLDETTLAMPDRRGNRRLDSLRNIVRDPRAALIFLIPGVGETLRVNGRAEIISDPDFCAEFAMEGKVPQSVILVAVERVYFQCQKALVRSRLWRGEAQVPRENLPSAGDMLQALSRDGFDGKAYDQAYPKRMKQTIY